MQPPKDSTSLVGLLQCEDDTAAVYGRPHPEAEQEVIRGNQRRYTTVRLTREAGEALRELLDEWLGPKE